MKHPETVKVFCNHGVQNMYKSNLDKVEKKYGSKVDLEFIYPNISDNVQSQVRKKIELDLDEEILYVVYGSINTIDTIDSIGMVLTDCRIIRFYGNEFQNIRWEDIKEVESKGYYYQFWGYGTGNWEDEDTISSSSFYSSCQSIVTSVAETVINANKVTKLLFNDEDVTNEKNEKFFLRLLTKMANTQEGGRKKFLNQKRARFRLGMKKVLLDQDLYIDEYEAGLYDKYKPSDSKEKVSSSTKRSKTVKEVSSVASDYDESSDFDDEVVSVVSDYNDYTLEKWNWGAFLYNCLWAVCNRVYWPLLMIVIFFIPYVGIIADIVISFILGKRGNRMSWMKVDSMDLESFLKRQYIWNKVGFWSFWALIVLFVLYIIGSTQN